MKPLIQMPLGNPYRSLLYHTDMQMSVRLQILQQKHLIVLVFYRHSWWNRLCQNASTQTEIHWSKQKTTHNCLHWHCLSWRVNITPIGRTSCWQRLLSNWGSVNEHEWGLHKVILSLGEGRPSRFSPAPLPTPMTFSLAFPLPTLKGTFEYR